MVPRLIRANLPQTGVLFAGRLDTTIGYFAGPLDGAGCHLDDLSDMRRLRLEAANRTAVAAPVNGT